VLAPGLSWRAFVLPVLLPWGSHIISSCALQYFCKVTKTDLNVLVGALSEPKHRQLKRFKTNVDILSTTERNICSRFI
jgi:hypothetical protein